MLVRSNPAHPANRTPGATRNSLASVVHEMLAGDPPYTGPTAQTIVAKRFREPDPHLSTLGAVPPAIEAAIPQRWRKPADCYQTASQFVRAVAHATVGGTADSPAARTSVSSEAEVRALRIIAGCW
jgi:hypothetical protein